MQVVIRTYYGKGTKQLFDVGEQHEVELQRLMHSVPGLISYTLARSNDGGFSVTVCQDHQGIEHSVQTARNFLAQHAPTLSLAAMQITEGTVIVHVQ